MFVTEQLKEKFLSVYTPVSSSLKWVEEADTSADNHHQTEHSTVHRVQMVSFLSTQSFQHAENSNKTKRLVLYQL